MGFDLIDSDGVRPGTKGYRLKYQASLRSAHQNFIGMVQPKVRQSSSLDSSHVHPPHPVPTLSQAHMGSAAEGDVGRRSKRSRLNTHEIDTSRSSAPPGWASNLQPVHQAQTGQHTNTVVTPTGTTAQHVQEQGHQGHGDTTHSGPASSSSQYAPSGHYAVRQEAAPLPTRSAAHSTFVPPHSPSGHLASPTDTDTAEHFVIHDPASWSPGPLVEFDYFNLHSPGR